MHTFITDQSMPPARNRTGLSKRLVLSSGAIGNLEGVARDLERALGAEGGESIVANGSAEGAERT
jgi:hypothetical protein